MNQLNTQLSTYGISASIATDGTLQFGGSTAFTVTAGALANGATGGVVATPATTPSIRPTTRSTARPPSTVLRWRAGHSLASRPRVPARKPISIQSGKGTTSSPSPEPPNAGAGNATTLTQALQTLNTALSGTGISAVQNAGRRRHLVSKRLVLQHHADRQQHGRRRKSVRIGHGGRCERPRWERLP